MPWIYCYRCEGTYPLDNKNVQIYKVGKTGHKDPNQRTHEGLNKPMKNAYIDICIKVKNHSDVEDKLKSIMKNDDKFTFIYKIGLEYHTNKMHMGVHTP